MSTNNTFEVQVLVNGNRCKQYQHQGKTFIEAKNGSEYVLEIKNNYYKRILAVSAVDGLNVLTGKSATEQDSGYVIDAYHSEKIKGFRFSDDEWSMFKFGYKFNGKTYAQSKNDGSEVNCGVIGVRLFYEYEPAVQYIYNNAPPIQWNWNPQWIPNKYEVTYTCGSGGASEELGGLYGKGRYGYNDGGGILRSSGAGEKKYTCNVGDTVASNNVSVQNMSLFCDSSVGQSEIKSKGFDMGTEWGRKEANKVTTVSFTKGYQAHSLDIYYASRESLIQMGVPITNELKVNLPQSFPNKYATPPSGWVGE